jgi:Polysaccharide pyruvyl transferase
MRVLITGGNFVNQGAYLMLVAAATALRERFDAYPVLDLKQGTERQKRELGADTLWTPKLARKVGIRAKGAVPKLTRGRLPYVMASEIDAVVDVSGFRYGDQWAHLALDARADYLAYWRSHGVPVIMLPQALGPFEQTAGPALTALRSARLVMPRDPDSERYARDLLHGVEDVEIARCSDFTVGLRGRAPRGYEHLAGGVPIVPNWNIAERSGTEEGRQAYVRTLTEVVTHLRGRGLEPYGLSHEGARDVAVLSSVREAVGDLEIVSGLDGLRLKGLLGTAHIVVAGRFHALVSALSQGVPSVIHGWSHKYEWLARDFAAEDLLASPLEGGGPTIGAVDRALDDAALRSRIGAAAQVQKARVDEMWAMVGRHLS